MADGYVRTGILKDGRVVELDEALPVEDTKVRVHIEPLTARF
jgi:hypothetical protein